jgi:hypothetical protein
MERGGPLQPIQRSPGAANTHSLSLFFFSSSDGFSKQKLWTLKNKKQLLLDGWMATTVAAVGPFSLFGLWCL